MYLIGRTTGYHFDMSDQGFADFRKNGLRVIEHSVSQKIYYEPKFVQELAARHDVKIWSCHLPFRPYDASSPDKEERAKAFAQCAEQVKKGADAGIDKFVLHPGYPFQEESERPERLKCAMEFVNDLAELAHKEGAVIAVEDMPHCIGKTIDELEALINTNDKLRVCFDVNHLLHNTHEEFIHRLGSRIITVHFSDYDYVDERHAFPTEGKIDWVKLIKNLYSSGYTGPWIYECSGKEKTNKEFYETAVRILKEAGVPEVF